MDLSQDRLRNERINLLILYSRQFLGACRFYNQLRHQDWRYASFESSTWEKCGS